MSEMLVLHDNKLTTDSQNKIIVSGSSTPQITRDEEHSFFTSSYGTTFESFHLPPLTENEVSTFDVELNNYSTLINDYPDLNVAIVTFDLSFQTSTAHPLTYVGNGTFAFDTPTSLAILESRAYFIRIGALATTHMYFYPTYIGRDGHYYGTHPRIFAPEEYGEDAAGAALSAGDDAINANRTGNYVDL